MSRLDLDLKDLGGWLQRLAHPAEQVNWDRVWRATGLVLESETKRNFDRAVSPDGQSWAPLKKLRSHGRNRSKATQKPLRDTGLLMASLSAQGSHHVAQAKGRWFEFGTNLDYSGFHQDGTKHIPARPFLGINEAVTEQLADVIADEVTRTLGG